ncbi:MAG: hypothetical protein FJ290_30235 [Planctomycetes bacterium]|nr:hypothetical protein [Planctomycetota bacterium]
MTRGWGVASLAAWCALAVGRPAHCAEHSRAASWLLQDGVEPIADLVNTAEPGKHTVRIAFDDFPRHTRWRPGGRVRDKPEATHVPNPLRPHHIGSIAIGVDERVRSLQPIRLRPELAGKHPRLSGKAETVSVEKPLGPDDKRVQDLVLFLDPDRAPLWEYSDDAESMASASGRPPASSSSSAPASTSPPAPSSRTSGATPCTTPARTARARGTTTASW